MAKKKKSTKPAVALASGAEEESAVIASALGEVLKIADQLDREQRQDHTENSPQRARRVMRMQKARDLLLAVAAAVWSIGRDDARERWDAIERAHGALTAPSPN